jgi:DNA-directed RNA polymerase subunit M/transcription elongation factor TFIIS
MHKQLGKVGAIRREVQGKACPFCGGRTYQLVLRPSAASEPAGLFARCTTCQHPRGLDEDFGKILWM